MPWFWALLSGSVLAAMSLLLVCLLLTADPLALALVAGLAFYLGRAAWRWLMVTSTPSVDMLFPDRGTPAQDDRARHAEDDALPMGPSSLD